MLSKRFLLSFTSISILTACGKSDLTSNSLSETLGYEEGRVRVLDQWYFGEENGAVGDSGNTDNTGNNGGNGDNGNNGNNGGNGTNDTPVLEELDACPAVTLAKTLQGGEFQTVSKRGVSIFEIQKKFKYRIVDSKSFVLANGSSATISGSFEKYTNQQTRMQFDSSVMDLLKSHKLFLKGAATFSGFVHFCKMSDVCALTSTDRVFSLKINARTFLPRKDISGGNNEAASRVFDASNFVDTEKQICQIDLNPTNSPLVLDLGRGITLSDPSQIASRFDLDGNGVKENVSCLQNGAFLALPNTEGEIRDIHQLFGNHTVGPDGHEAANGFEALAKFDGNGDGFINSDDSVFEQLRLWEDRNCDGSAQAEELLSLRDASLKRVDLNYVNMYEQDAFGNETKQRSTTESLDNTVRAIFDVWFASFED